MGNDKIDLYTVDFILSYDICPVDFVLAYDIYIFMVKGKNDISHHLFAFINH
jgi:hypothetical protein